MATTVSAEVINHSQWNTLLHRHVSTVNDSGVAAGQATVVDYQGMTADREQLQQYLQLLAQVGQADFDRWSQSQQLAFLINAYNAWTIELVLGRWPKLQSIKDVGGWFSSPWRKKFIPLLGQTRSLDDIEHELIRASGRYNDPRIHFAVNCASIGCPALRAEAYSGDTLDAQLEAQTQLFLADRSRNRINGNTLELSSIFSWYQQDFERGWKGFNRLEEFILAYRESLKLTLSQAEQLKAGKLKIRYLDYNWQLNGKR